MTHPPSLEAPATPQAATNDAPLSTPVGGAARRWARWAGPVWPLLVLLSALTVEIRFLAHSSWRPVVLYDGDSLTFAVLWRSLSRGEPIHPVMSSQLLLFPEGVIYAVAHLCTTSISATLVGVAVINVVLFYLGLRAIAAVVVDGSADRRRLAALVPTLLLISAMLLERTMGVDTTTIATPMLFDSFYGGVILAGLGAIGFAVRQLRWTADRSMAGRLAASAVVAGALGLTIISDPLFLIQVTGPFLVVVAGLWALRLIRASQLAWLAGPQVIGVALYKVLAPLYRRYVGEATKGYVHPKFAAFAYKELKHSLQGILASTAGRWEVALVASAWIVGLAAAALLLVRSWGPSARRTPEHAGRLLVSVFGVLASLAIIGVVIYVGDAQPRYLLPVVTFPFLSLVPVADLRLARRLPLAARMAPGAVLAAVAILGLTALPGAASILRPERTAAAARYGTPLNESCLERAFDHRPANGVAAYWTARATDLYNPDNERVLQVKLNERIFPWLVNLGSYEHRQFSFVLVDKFDHAEWTMRPNDVVKLGRPARIVSCPSFDIYTYPPGTPGYRRLNTTIDESLRADLRRYA